MASSTSSTTRSASKRAPRATPRTVPPTVADVVTPVGLDLDADIADVVATHGTLDTIESGHAAALVALTERTDYALSEYVRLARVWKSQRRAIGGFHVAIGSGDKNTHRRLMLAGELWDAYQTVPDVSVSLLRCLRWVHVSDAKEIARDILSIRSSVSDTVGLSLDLPVRQVKATRKAVSSFGKLAKKSTDALGILSNAIDSILTDQNGPIAVIEAIAAARSAILRRRSTQRATRFALRQVQRL